MVDFMNKIYDYVEEFNRQDEEIYSELIKNEEAAEWMEKHIPYLECPDPLLEKVYYYRWWVYRKHIKNTPDGYVVTEFMPNVGWAGKYNTINAPAAHHISEGKWLFDPEGYIRDNILFWIEQKSKAHSYSTWLIYAVAEYCRIKGDYSIGTENLDKLCAYYEKWEQEHLSDNGMFWSIDNRDGMEFSISGTDVNMTVMKGFRPTLNSYMAADAWAISEFARLAGRQDIEKEYKQKSEKLKELIVENLWDGDFFKAIHCSGENGEPVLGKPDKSQDVRELIGYIPWCFDLPPAGMENAFSYLKSSDGFKAAAGLTTAEQNHPRFLYEANHECLWNGYVWPYATTQALNAVLHLLKNYTQNVIDKDDFYDMLLMYAKAHRKLTDDGREIMWIDEVLHPETGEWTAEKILRDLGFPEKLGGYERGKDYNHSTFCDIILGGLLGISVGETQAPDVKPIIPDWWEYFKVDNLELCNKKYCITYDKNGDIYNVGKGIVITEKEK